MAAELSDQNRQAQAAIENFKLQAEETSKKTFQEMKQQACKSEFCFAPILFFIFLKISVLAKP